MAIFKEADGMKMVDDEKVVVKDFVRRTPFWGHRNISYHDYEPLMNLKQELDEYLEKLFHGEIDDGNADVLDNIIFDRVRQAMEDLKYQSVEHEDMNCSFENRVDSDLIAFKEERENLMKDLEFINREYDRLMKMYEKNEYKEEK